MNGMKDKTMIFVVWILTGFLTLKKCGDNALEILYGLQQGMVYSDYAMIPFCIESINVKSASENRVLCDYEKLKEWWNNEK